jgi:DNA gyrase subunit B
VSEYSSDSIQVLTGLEGVRRRPGMYIGDTTTTGLRNLLWQVVQDVIDAHLAGYASELRVELHPDGWVAVRDDGPGISTAPLPNAEILTRDDPPGQQPTTLLELLFMQLWTGSRWQGAGATTGLFGVGPVVVNALSERLEVDTTHDGVAWTQTFERGERVCAARRLGLTRREGTSIRFRPDPAIFEVVTLDHELVRARLHELAWLHPHLRIWFQEQRIGTRGGVAAWTRSLAHERGEVVASTVLAYAHGGVAVELGLAWNPDGAPLVRAYVNDQPSTRGCHVDGLWLGFAQYARALGSPARRVAHVREAAGAGLVAVMNVRVANPQFTSQTRDELRSGGAMHAVRAAVDSLRRPDAWPAWDVRRMLDDRLHVPGRR